MSFVIAVKIQYHVIASKVFDGWISPDGKRFIGLESGFGPGSTHADIAENILEDEYSIVAEDEYELEDDLDNPRYHAMDNLLAKGWFRTERGDAGVVIIAAGKQHDHSTLIEIVARHEAGTKFLIEIAGRGFPMKQTREQILQEDDT